MIGFQHFSLCCFVVFSCLVPLVFPAPLQRSRVASQTAPAPRGVLISFAWNHRACQNQEWFPFVSVGSPVCKMGGSSDKRGAIPQVSSNLQSHFFLEKLEQMPWGMGVWGTTKKIYMYHWTMHETPEWKRQTALLFRLLWVCFGPEGQKHVPITNDLTWFGGNKEE